MPVLRRFTPFYLSAQFHSHKHTLVNKSAVENLPFINKYLFSLLQANGEENER